MSAAVRAFRDASRQARSPLVRAALARAGSALCSARRRTRVRVRDHGDIWAHHHPDATLFFPEITATAPAALAAQAAEIFLWEHTPGPGATVVDVGAAVGEETLTFSRLVGPTGRVIAIEAHPRTFRCLEAAVAANGCTNVTALHLAASDAEGTLSISDDDGFLGNSVVAGGGAYEVRAASLDQIAREQGLEEIDLLKLNIEGAETGALAAVPELLQRVAHIVVSCHDFKAERTGEEAFRTREAVRELLTDAGFEVLGRPEHRHPWVRDTLYGRRP